MKDKPKIRYPVRTLRSATDVWIEFNKNRSELELSWNQYLKHINKLLNKHK